MVQTLKTFIRDLTNNLKDAVSTGNFFRANDITANIMVGAIMFLMVIVSVLCLICNEVGLFTVDKTLMRWSTAIIILFNVPISTVNSHHAGDLPWLKKALISTLIIQCMILAVALGHNVYLLMLLPPVLSIRYFDKNFTSHVAIGTLVCFFIATIANCFYGIVNLNVYPVATGTTLTIVDSLRATIDAMGIDSFAYLKAALINEFIPRFLLYTLISTGCVLIAQRGREMIDFQNEMTTKNARVETELNLATQIQAGMLPCTFPAFPNLTQLDLYAQNIPAKEVGGDFYDYFTIDDDHVAIVMADVSGKGVGAALFMTISKIVIKNQLQLGIRPADALTKANEQLCENNEGGLFVTVWAGVYEISTQKMTYVNAGHNPPILMRNDGKCEYLKGKNGFVLAGMEDVIYSQSEITLDVDDEIFLYTDGVTEATDTNNELYGEDRLLSLMTEHRQESVEQQINLLFSDVNKFAKGAPQFDDITMLGMIVKHRNK